MAGKAGFVELAGAVPKEVAAQMARDAEESASQDNFTEDQMYTLHNVIQTIKDMHPEIEVIGHSDVEPKKPHCPGFNVKEWYQDEFIG